MMEIMIMQLMVLLDRGGINMHASPIPLIISSATCIIGIMAGNAEVEYEVLDKHTISEAVHQLYPNE